RADDRRDWVDEPGADQRAGRDQQCRGRDDEADYGEGFGEGEQEEDRPGPVAVRRNEGRDRRGEFVHVAIRACPRRPAGPPVRRPGTGKGRGSSAATTPSETVAEVEATVEASIL